jgi:GAF domain-containing protein
MIKNRSKKTKPKPPAKSSTDAAVSQLKKTIAVQAREIREGAEQQTATSEILRVIASLPTDVQPVLDAVAENAARLCGASDALIYRIDENVLRLAAHFGPLAWMNESMPLNRGSVTGRAIVDRQTIHVHYLAAEPDSEFPVGKILQQRFGQRTVLATPLLRQGIPIGAIAIRRMEIHPFSDKQISLLKTFADQAAIAIENVRLFQELKEALERQTATSEILGVIASSPTDVQPVLETVAETAARLCGANDASILRIKGDALERVAMHGSLPAPNSYPRISRGTPLGRAVLDRRTIHVHDMEAVLDTEFPEGKDLHRITGVRSILVTPLMRESKPVGIIVVRRTEVRPFTDRQIGLLQTFADQALIAIENVRLFQELKESLEQQTATSEILGVIARSPTDVQPVLDVVAENAARLCDSSDAQIFRVDGDMVRKVASYGITSPVLGVGETRPIRRGSPSGRAILDLRPVHIHDIGAEREEDFPDVWLTHRSLGIGTALAVPLLREGVAVGAITIRRTEVRPFIDKQNRHAQDLRRSGGHRYRERALVQRDPGAQCGTARGAGASDRNG